MIQLVRGKPCSIVSFLSGVSAKRPNAAQCRAVGAALGGLHNALANHEGHRPNSLGPADWVRLFEPEIAQVAEALEPNLHALIDSDLAAIAQDWPQSLPTGVIHADLFPDNVLFLRNEVSGLIDFYFACTDILAYDLAVMLNAWCFEPSGREFDLIKGRSLISGYESIRPLSALERKAIPILARGAALRFFLTRLIDWNATPPGALVRPKDPRDYSARLAFHRNAKTIGDYGG
jgi:homoserine kinase type II